MMKRLAKLLYPLLGASIASGYFMYNRQRLLQYNKKTTKKNYPSVSIIIPARDEEVRLPRLLTSLNQQSISPEIIVMNDGSKDNTRVVALSYGAKVIDVVEGDDARWYGKSFACYQGVQYATSDIFIFIDADVQLLDSHALESILQAYEKQSYRGLLSIQPYHLVKKVYEQFSALFNLMTVVGMNQFSSLSHHKQTLAFGPVTVMKKEDYVLTQGHKNAECHIIEGFALAQAFSNYNLPVSCYEGKGFVGFRMYEEGTKSLIQGWTKHFATGASRTEGTIMFMIMTWMMGITFSHILLLLSFVTKTVSKKWGGLSYFLYLIQFIRLHKRVGSFSILFLIMNPLLFVVFVFVFINSYCQTHFTKKVRWKGRTFKIN